MSTHTPRRFRAMPPVLLLAGLFGLACFGTSDTPEITKDADAKLQSGDLPGAEDAYAKLHTDHADSVYAAQGAAYSQMLAGQYAQADALLADAEAKATKATMDPTVLAGIRLRRALVALRAGKLDDVKAHGTESNLPAGQVLAAEVHLADAEVDEAKQLLRQAEGAGGPVGDTAKEYLRMLGSDVQAEQGLAEATALWATGQRTVAVEQAEELVKALPEEQENKSELLLIWAGRAVTAGRPSVASAMIDAMGFPPENQAWRVQATKAMIAVAEGHPDEAVTTFDALQSAGAPADGLADARATAAALTTDAEAAKRLIGATTESAAVARGLLQAGASDAAKQAAGADGAFAKYLGAQ